MGPQDRDARKSASPADRPTIPPTAASTPVPPSTTVIRAVPTGPLTLGQTFGRYHIIKLLGIGGMGAVYQAWDHELGVAVAVKVIRPDAIADPVAAQEVERRFKRELLLARQVTHKNVVRIHDLGEIDGIKYITMTYVEGEDLATKLKREGRLPVPRALHIARQVAAGLTAAHEVGVVHRDLKPANIMVDATDHALIMDFGIARSERAGSAGGTDRATAVNAPAPTEWAPKAGDSSSFLNAATVAGVVVGTLEYMAPEQAQGKPADHRADLYAFGLILTDLLLGPVRLSGNQTPASELTARMLQAPPPLRKRDASVPEAIDRVVARCVQPDPAARFSTAAELLTALNRMNDQGVPIRLPRRVTTSLLAATIVAIAAIVGSTWWVARRQPPPVVQHDPVPVLVADFENRANDPVFDGAVEQSLAISLEGASFITSYSRTSAKALAQQLKSGAKLDAETARLVALREGIGVVLSGAIEQKGTGYAIQVQAVDPQGKVLKQASADAKSKADVLTAVGTLATQIRRALGDTSPATDAQAETFTAASLDAVREYQAAQDLASAARDEEAIARYRAALQFDPNLGRAYSGIAISAGRLGRVEEADQAFKTSLTLLNRQTERERFRSLGAYYLLIAHNYEKAVENYAELVKRYPADRAGHSNLAVAYFSLLNFSKAREEGQQAIQIYPKIPTLRNNFALFAMYAGDFATASTEAAKVLAQDPKFSKAYLPVAVAALADGKADAAREAYTRMAATGTVGASLATLGLADVALYEGKAEEAIKLLEPSIDADIKARSTARAAAKLIALADAALSNRKADDARNAAASALKLDTSDATRVAAARILLRTDREADARKIAADLDRQINVGSRAYAKIIEGEIALQRHRPTEAIDAFRAATGLRDLWLARLDLGIAYVDAQHHAEALSEFETCRKRRGEASALFLDDQPTFRLLAPLPGWLAQAQKGLGIAP
jgi:serine/threonine protein kinase/tetratricopeptide (TPR) repeat protein